jgi:DNA-binding XRE family transcriptional regulator
MSNQHLGDSWDSLRKEIYTPEEIAACDLKVAVINEIIKAREENGISQRQLEKISGVKQPIIARMEKGTSTPQLSTILRILAPLGKTLKVVPIEPTSATV